MTAIDLSDIRYHYPKSKDTLVLDIPSWRMDTGAQLLLHGPSGAGKSTLLNIICGILPVSEGKVCVLGERLDKLSSKQRDRFRANHIGYVFQQLNLIPYLNAIENISIAAHFCKLKGKKVTESDIKALLNQLNLPEKNWDNPARNLSVGQQQRVAIARALITRPELLIADEPTSSLDQANRDNFMSLLMPLVKEHNISLLFVSHDMGLSRYFASTESLNKINQISDVNAGAINVV